jgi:hypothetical protein
MRAPAKGSIHVSPTWSAATFRPLSRARAASGENGAPGTAATASLGFGGRGMERKRTTLPVRSQEDTG